ncbi:RagB/SusD family nutrient uptake outer membrane protein [Ancylomarina sp. YFZ004]
MNKLLYLLAFIGLGLVHTSCEKDFLTQEDPDNLAINNFWRNQSDAEAGLSSAYSQLECATDYWAFAEIKFPVELYTSDLVNLGGDAYNYEDWFTIYNFDMTPGNTQTSAYWEIHYRGINYANQVIENVGLMAEEKIAIAERDKIVAEAKFLRAYYHLKLLMSWEKIIIRETYPKGDSETSKALSTRLESWDFIIADFEAASKLLPESFDANNTGRATKWAALGYLGKAYLFRAGEEAENAPAYYLSAKEAFKAVVDNGNYELVNSYISLFDGTNQNSTESIFELQLSGNTANGAYYKFPSHRWLKPAGLGGWDEIAGSDFLLEEFKKEGKTATDTRYDDRLYSTLFFDDEYFNDPANPRVYGYTFNDWWDYNGVAHDKTGFRKYLPKSEDDLNSSQSSINIPLMRYADLLLMYAETLNNLDETSAAIPFINTVRARANMPATTATTKAEIMNQIEHERICELAMEGSRFHDLRRWNKLIETMGTHGRTLTSEDFFFPIPEKEQKNNSEI